MLNRLETARNGAARCLSPFPADHHQAGWPVGRNGTGTKPHWNVTQRKTSRLRLGASPVSADSFFRDSRILFAARFRERATGYAPQEFDLRHIVVSPFQAML